MLCTSTYGAARLFSVKTGELISLLGGFGNVIREASYSPDGKFIVVASYDGGAKVFAADGTYLDTLKAGQKDENDEGFIISRIKFSPDSRFVFFSTRTAPKAINKWALPCETDKTLLNGLLGSMRPTLTREYSYAAKVSALKYATPRMVSKAYYDLLGISPIARNSAEISSDGYSFADSVSIMQGGCAYVRSQLDTSYEDIAIKVTNNADGSSKLFYPDTETLLSSSVADNYTYVERVMKLKLEHGGEYTVEVIDAGSGATLASCSAFVDAEKSATEDFLYKIENDEVTILHCISGKRDVVVPSEIEGYPVTKIGSYAFDGYGTNVMHMKVTLPDTLKVIGSYAFNNCWSLREITFPAGLEKIEQNAFSRCRLLSVVDIPAGTTVNSNAFSNAGIGTIKLHSGSGIASGALSGMSRVREIIVDDGIENLSLSISSQYLLEAVYIPESVTSISGGIYSFVDNNVSDLHTKYRAKIYGVEGSYAQTYAEAYPTKFIFVPIGAPIVSGVENGKTYDLYEGPVSATWENGHIGYLNGEPCYRHADPTEPGEYTLEVINGYDEYKTTVTFTVVDTTPPPYTIGDVDEDGEITVADALTALRIALGIAEPEGYQADAADVDMDGAVTVSDVLRILRVAAKLESFE